MHILFFRPLTLLALGATHFLAYKAGKKSEKPGTDKKAEKKAEKK